MTTYDLGPTGQVRWASVSSIQQSKKERESSVRLLRENNSAFPKRRGRNGVSWMSRVPRIVIETVSVNTGHFGTLVTRFPRFKRRGSLKRFCWNPHLAGDLRKGQPLSNDALYCHIEPLSIVHFAIVKTICLLVQVAE